MTQPLSHYWVSSGHNSYLEGNQLTSTAGTRTIEIGLKHGCRVVELDVYDGPEEPVVTHGGTLTSTVTFNQCVEAVAKLGFATSPYPVILTIENHVKQQQGQMVKVLHDVLGDHLFIPDPDQLTRDGKWLSPDALKHKVVIRMKVKPGITAPELAKLVYICNSSIKGYDVSAGPLVPSSHSLPDSKLPQVTEYIKFGPASKLFSFHNPQAVRAAQAAEAATVAAANGSISSTASSLHDAAATAGRDQGSKAAASDRASLAPSTPVLPVSTAAAATPSSPPAAADTTAATAAAAAGGGGSGGLRKLESFQLSADDLAQEEALEIELDDTLVSASFKGTPPSEQDLTRPSLSAVLEYTSKHLLRCYPSAWRMIDNSNPNPAAAWACGVSLAALNWQLWDQAVWINDAFFSRFNNSGYILKPKWMTTDIPSTGVPDRQSRSLSVTVYSAYRPQGKRVGVWKDDLYVELRIVGMPHDTVAQQSPHVNNTGRLIVDKTFKFDVQFPELAVLLLLLKDQDTVMTDTVLGYAALPLANLNPGAYQFPLADPGVMGGSTSHTGMWMKVNLAWQDTEAVAA